MTSWTTTLEEDGDDLILPIPNDVIAHIEQTQGIKIKDGDPLWFEIRDNKSVAIHFIEPPNAAELDRSTVRIVTMEA